jgi:hypothetical protein
VDQIELGIELASIEEQTRQAHADSAKSNTAIKRLQAKRAALLEQYAANQKSAFPWQLALWAVAIGAIAIAAAGMPEPSSRTSVVADESAARESSIEVTR